MIRYLVTDPCYVVPDADWMDFLENHSHFGVIENGEAPYEIEGFGRILVSEASEGGDGEWKVGNGKSVCADAGLTCIVELNHDTVVEEHHGNAVTRTLGVAEHWFSRVVGREMF